MASVKTFLDKYTAFTHWLGGALTSLMAAYLFVPEFHAYVLYLYGLFPPWLAKLATVAVALVLFYHKGQPAEPPPPATVTEMRPRL